MTTPAKRAGIVKGQKYIARSRPGQQYGDAGFGSGMVDGSIVELNHDDGSTIPYFNRLNADGTVAHANGLIDLDRVDFTPLHKGVTFEEKEVKATITVITADRQLTAEEKEAIAAIIYKGAK